MKVFQRPEQDPLSVKVLPTTTDETAVPCSSFIPITATCLSGVMVAQDLPSLLMVLPSMGFNIQHLMIQNHDFKHKFAHEFDLAWKYPSLLETLVLDAQTYSFITGTLSFMQDMLQWHSYLWKLNSIHTKYPTYWYNDNVCLTQLQEVSHP
eukprot:6097843-Ditylum_brightwellii.AAC.1